MFKLKIFLPWNAVSGVYDGDKENRDQLFVDYAVADMLDNQNERYEAERQQKRNALDDDWIKPPKRF